MAKKKVIAEDWVGNQYYTKREVVNASTNLYWETTGENYTANEVIAHYKAIFNELPEKMVIEILKTQDRLFCMDD